MFPIISSENEKRLDKLAYDIVMFFQDYDWYEYCDVVDDLTEMPVYEFQRIMTVDVEFDKLISYFWNDLLMDMTNSPKNEQLNATEILFSRLLNLFHDLYPEKQLSIQPKFDEFKKHALTFVSYNSCSSDLNNKISLIYTLIMDNSDGSLDSTLNEVFNRLTEAELSIFEATLGTFDKNISEADVASLFNGSSLTSTELKYLWDKFPDNYDKYTYKQFLESSMFGRGLERRN